MSFFAPFVAAISYVVERFLWVVVIPISSFFGFEYTPPAVTIATSTPAVITIATSSLPIVAPKPPPVKPPVAVVVTPPIPSPPPVVPTPAPKPVLPPVVVPGTVGTTTLAVQSIPLLTGGEVHAGQTVPISYLQITNVGTNGTVLKGFRLSQQGSAPDEAIIGLSTVDDQGGSRGSVGGNEAATPFKNGVALAPTEAYFAPGQMRLFTIKAMLSHQVSSQIGTQLTVVVSSIEGEATVQGTFPISGTTWTIAP
jgi:hypothetical protein